VETSNQQNACGQSSLITSQGIRLMQADDDAVELERLKAENASGHAAYQRLCDSFEVAVAELERLRKGIAAAPHAWGCEANILRWRIRNAQEPCTGDCNCWKAALAAGGQG